MTNAPSIMPTRKHTQRNSGVTDYMPTHSHTIQNTGMIDIYQKVLDEKNHEIN